MGSPLSGESRNVRSLDAWHSPRIATDLRLSDEVLQWVPSIYFLLLAAALAPDGAVLLGAGCVTAAARNLAPVDRSRVPKEAPA